MNTPNSIAPPAGVPVAEDHGRGRHWSGMLLSNPAYAAGAAVLGRYRRVVSVVLVALPILWLLLWNVVPLFQMLHISFLHEYPTQISEGPVFSFEHYVSLFDDSSVYQPFIRTIGFAFATVVATFLMMLPIAYFLAKKVSPRWQIRLLLLVLIPAWVSELIRIFAYIIILASNGALNNLLRMLGLIERPIPFLYNWFSLGGGVLYVTGLFMLVPLYAALEKVPTALLEAAADLGANPLQVFFKVTLPLIRDGIATGTVLVFLMASGMYTVPVLLSGPGGGLFSQVIASSFYESALTWPQGAAFSIALFATALAISGVLNFFIRPRKRKARAS